MSTRAWTAFAFGTLGFAAGCGASVGTPVPDADGGQTIDPSVSRLVVSAASPSPRITTWSVNYWMWPSAYADDVSGTEAAVAPLVPAVMRVGGYNNDANTPMPFDDAELDRAVAYARAIGAEPLLQVPLLAAVDGSAPTADTAAAMVTYANVTQAYGVKYFSIGNEPDLYATQGSLTSMSAPAIPGYTPAAFCASARAYVGAMKAVDPTIQIVGPDLSWKYIPGNDWLTPILSDCGDLFDIVAIHRYPFSSDAATLDAAQSDATAFEHVLASVHGLMAAAGQGDKPLALTEMNVVYNATTCQHSASPTTMGSALWLADSLGTSIDNDVWTSAVWDISDDDGFALGLLGPAPAHQPRPEYFAYQLYAEHFGPTRLEVTQVPTNVRAYASRNPADNATEVIAINWSTASAPLALEVTGLAKAPTPAEYTLPALSITAIEVPDHGVPKAWTYGEAQRQTSSAPVALATGLADAVDAGPPLLKNPCSNAPATSCPKAVLPSATITTSGTSDGTTLTFGDSPYQWTSYAYAAPGQAAPVAATTSNGQGIQITGGFVPPLSGGNWEGVGLYLESDSCADASSYTGVKFDLTGTVGDCTLAFGASFSGDDSASDDPGRGTCPGSESVCYPPMAAVTPPASSKDATTVKVPFASLGAGSPIATVDPTTLIAVQWQLNAPAGGACTASFTVENVAFY